MYMKKSVFKTPPGWLEVWKNERPLDCLFLFYFLKFILNDSLSIHDGWYTNNRNDILWNKFQHDLLNKIFKKYVIVCW